MPRLLYASASPYSAKVRMCAAHAGVTLEAVIVDTNAPTPELLSANPLGRIPTLITDDGVAVHDSSVITQYLNRVGSTALFPRNAGKRLEAENLESLADGLCDCLLAHVYERRFRPEELVHAPWLDRQWEKVTRTLDAINANPPKLPARINAGHIAMRACLGYLDLRFAGKWDRGRSRLKRWAKRFDDKFPELVPYLPR